MLEPSPDIDTLLAVLTLRRLIARLRQIELGLRVSDVCAGVRARGQEHELQRERKRRRPNDFTGLLGKWLALQFVDGLF